MNDSNNRLLIISAAILILVAGMALMAFLLRPAARKKEKVVEETYQELETAVERDVVKRQTSVSTRFSGISYKPASRNAPFTEDDLKEMALNRQSAEKKLRIAQEKYLLDIINNESFNQRTREKYRLRSLDSYVDGMKAFDKGNYEESIKLLAKTLKDPNATDVSRYLVLIYLRSAAHRIRNFDLFLEFSRAQSRLVQSKDLSMLGIEKTDSALAFCDDMEELYKAAIDNKGYNKALEKRIFTEDGIVLNVKSVKEQLDQEIEEFKKEFRGFFSDV
jgi:hypothetical protein